IKGTFIYVTHDQTEAMTLGDRIVVMKDGVVQQIATPQEVFNHPANIFVAGFIGVPQMNFFDAQLVRSGNGFTVKTEDMNVALSPETCAQLALNWDGGDVKEITAGVRPEQILLADKGEEGALQGTVEVTELMGSTEHVHVTAPDGQFVLIIPVVDLEAKGALKAGDTIWFKFEKNATHLFDKVSGKNLI
ncbi:MAG: TOBE domain-containing protein, partial [Collinsella sp.]|nr:TOBE domain-containing protein [Collinsella sp.]